MNSKCETKIVRLHTGGDNRFGFTLVGQYPCQLVKIQNGSPAEKAGVRSGDEVIEVNGINVEDLKHNCVATFITPNKDGITELRIRRTPGSFTKTLKSGHNVLKSVSEEVHTQSRNDDDLSQAVDRVVKGLKRADVNSVAPSQQKGPDLSILNSDDIASDEQLKANFSPVKPSINTSLTADISTPIALHLKLASKNNSVSENTPSCKVLVGYLGSINRPMTNKTSLGLVTHLRVRKTSSVWVLLEISSAGIYLRNSSKQIIMMSPLNSLAYLGVCYENKQILAFFTEDLNTNDSNDVINNHITITTDVRLNCSCHVFVIEPRFGRHANHKTLIDSFQLLCDPTTGSCQQYFPTSTYTILNALQRISHQGLTRIASIENAIDCSKLNSHGSEVEILRELGVITPQELIKSDHSSTSVNSHKTQHDESQPENVLCLYLQPLYTSVSMKDKETDYPTKGNYSIEICCKDKATTGQESGPATLLSHRNKIDTDFATTNAEDTYMADKDLQKPHGEGTVAWTGHKTLVHQRSHSLASNVKNTVQAQAAAAAAVVAAHTVECHSQDLHIGNGIRQLYHASSASVLAGNTGCGHVEGKVARWAVAFDRLLEDKTGLDVFRSFLQKEFSEENLIFWLACEKYKTLEDEKKLKKCAEEIYEQHLKPRAGLPVNVDSTAIKEVETNLEHPSSQLFSSLQYQVYTLMKFDSYTRFLKSELYRQCLVNEMEGKPLPIEQRDDEKVEEEGTSTLRRMFSAKGKGRKSAPKSQTNTETDENRKKSILPWRGRLKSEQPKRNTNRSSDSQASSTRSSLSSLSDSVFSPNITNSNETLNDSDGKEQAPPTCKVILPNSSLMYLFCKSTRSLKEGLSKLCESKEYSLPALDIFVGGQKLTKEDLQRKLTRFINKEIILKQKILFRLELPKDRTIGIKADEQQKIEDVLEPILHQHGLDIKEYDICLRDSNQAISTSSSVSVLQQEHVIVKEKAINKDASGNRPVVTAKEHLAKSYSQHTATKSITTIDHKVFEGIMTGKRQSMSGFRFDDRGVFVPMVAKSQSRGSQESLTSIGKDREKMSRSPALFRKKKRNVTVSTFRTYLEEEKKSAEEFLILLHRSQNSRMDDQRGLLDHRNIEIPDFLKLQEAPKKRHSPLSVGVPSPRPVHHPLKKTISSPPIYASLVSKQQGNRPAVITEESKTRETLSRFTRNWSGSALGHGKIHFETVTETQTIDRRKFFKYSQFDTTGRLRSGSLPFSHPDDRCNDAAGGNELRTRNRYHYESETALNNNNPEVVWVSNTLNKNRIRGSTKTDPSADGGNESLTDDESSRRNFPKTEVIIPRGITNTDRFAMSGSVVPFRDRSKAIPGSPFFRDNMETAKRHVRTLAEQSKSRDITSGNDRQAILDNSFLKDQLKPSKLFSQHSPDLNPPVPTSPNERNDTPMKCPLYIPPKISFSSEDEFSEIQKSFKARANITESTVMGPSPRICWEVNEHAQTNDEGNVRVTFV